MSILLCKNLEVEVAGSTLLNDVNLRLEKGEKAGLIGPNGAGKTTLIKVITGELSPAGGFVACQAEIGYLPQTTQDYDHRGTVFECLLKERNDILEMRQRLRTLEQKMSQTADNKVLDQYGILTEQYENSGGYALEAKIRRILTGLGLAGEQEEEAGNLSGGQKTRLALGKLLLREPELLILDEPTNHLDLEALEWLENYLSAYPGAVMVVSHDRYFLDQVVRKIMLVENSTVKCYSGNYSEFELQRAIEEKTLAREAEKINKKISALEEYIRRYKAGIKARQARGRETQLKKLTPLAEPRTRKSLNMYSQAESRSGDRVLDIKELSVAYGEKKVLENISLELRRGDRIALLGKNGVGKTTLLKSIMGEVPSQGEIKIGAKVKIAYYSQEHEGLGDRNDVQDIMDELRYSSNMDDAQIRNFLARFGFRGDDVFKPLQALSGGEKSRLALCKLFLARGNLLLLDEPTNHLDMETREVLEEALLNYDGTMVVVSHDRYFLNRIINKVAILTARGIRIMQGDYSTYRQIIEDEEVKNTARADEDKAAQKYQLESKQNRRKERKIKQLEARIEEKESELKELEIKLNSLAGDYELALQWHEDIEKKGNELNELMEEWLALSDQHHWH
jgi:ATP-binding cassette subfamily F protein 3